VRRILRFTIGVTLATATPIAVLLAKPGDFVGKAVRVDGVVTNVCVETTARAGFVRDYYVAVVEDGTAAYVREDHEQTLRNIRRFFGVVTSIRELSELWGRPRAGGQVT